jgi:hypothetical protein
MKMSSLPSTSISVHDVEVHSPSLDELFFALNEHPGASSPPTRHRHRSGIRRRAAARRAGAQARTARA